MPLHVLSNFCNIQFLKKPSVFKTMSGDDQFLDVAIISLQVFSNTASIIVWIVNKPSFKYDTLIGLDTIKKFRLHQDEFLSISQVPFSPSPPVAVSPISDNLINWNEAIPVDKFEANIEHLSLDRRSQITSLIDKYSQVFARDNMTLVQYLNTKHISNCWIVNTYQKNLIVIVLPIRPKLNGRWQTCFIVV